MEKFNHIELNNEVTKRGDNGFFKLEKDIEAIEEFLREVDFRTVKFSSEMKRLRYLVEENFTIISLRSILKMKFWNV